MAAWERDFYTVLVSDSGLVALVGEQIYPTVAKDGANPPYVVYSRQATQRRISLDASDTTLEKVLANVSCYAIDHDGASAIARAVLAAVPQSGWPLHRTRHSNQDQGLDEETRLYEWLVQIHTLHR